QASALGAQRPVSVALAEIDDRQHFLAVGITPQIFNRKDPAGLAWKVRARGDVRRDDDVRRVPEWVVRGQRLGLHYIQAGACESMLVECVCKVGCDGACTACNVDEVRGWFEGGEEGGIVYAGRLWGKRHAVHDYVCGLGKSRQLVREADIT